MHRRTFIASMAALAAASPTLSRAQQAQFPPPPPLRDADGYLSVSHSEIFNRPRRDVIRSLQSESGSVLAFTEPTPTIPGIERFRPLSGEFPNQDAVRQLFLTDGNSVVERVLRNDEEAFVYQIWNFTSSNAWALDHIRGQFRYVPLGPNETRVTWTYSVAPAVFIARPFVNRFLTRDFQPFLTSGLTGAANAFNRVS